MIKCNYSVLRNGLDKVTDHKRKQTGLTGWFLYQEIKMQQRERMAAAGLDPDLAENQGRLLCECVRRLALSIPEGSVIAGTQDDAFSPSYALINPSFQVETFAGYCDPLAVYDDIEPSETIPRQRIESVRSYYASTSYVQRLGEIYGETGLETQEVAYFVEPVTGHVIPDLRPLLQHGVDGLGPLVKADSDYSKVMLESLDAACILAERYAVLAEQLLAERDDPEEQVRLKQIIRNCRKVPRFGAETLDEAVQSIALIWQVMCLEQAPNPYAFSVGNLDRILQPYLRDCPIDEAILLVRHLLAFFMVGDRCWAISQNVMVGGSDENGRDLTNKMTYIVLNAFYQSNNPQPALSVKLHHHTPERLYEEMGDFFFTPGHSTPSLFNDDSLFGVLRKKGVSETDLADYAIAGCQEPLIMGKEHANTTNSWLNLAKILELTLNDGCSLISGKKIGLGWQELGCADFEAVLQDLEGAFWRQLETFLVKMQRAANACTENLGRVAVPFCSALHGGLDSGRDMRDSQTPGTAYNASGCLIHGLSVVADSFKAVEAFNEAGIASADKLLDALKQDFEGYQPIQQFLLAQDKYGNNDPQIDEAVTQLARTVCRKVASLRNPAGNPFQPDFSTPSTHLLYGYWVGATPDGRNARTMLGYGIDPAPGRAKEGIQSRILSNARLDFTGMTGGYASHLGLDPQQFRDAASNGEKSLLLKRRVIDPLFQFNGKSGDGTAPFYVYFNIDEACHLRKVLAEPAKYAPDGIYIMRIHGTFVNFLDLSPAIQEDIIERLDPSSTSDLD